jgi:AcrR family transcriptional regulator
MPRGRDEARRPRHARSRRDALPIWAREDRGAPRRPRGRAAQGLTRDEVIRAALEVADAEGFEAVSMRNVAQRLGVGTMTLYSYVTSKEDVLDLMFDEVMRELFVPEPQPADWREALSQIARRTRDVWLGHPWMATSMGERSGFGPNSMRHVEQSLAAIRGLGVEGVEAFMILAAVDDYTLGHALRQVGMQQSLRREGINAQEWRDAMEPYFRDMIETGDFPHLAALADEDWDMLNEERFEAGLAWVLDGIAARYER